MRILGIDPGFGRMGYGVVEGKKGAWTHVAHGLLETPKTAAFSARLLIIRQGLARIIEQFHPTAAGVEELFFSKNVTTAIQVAHARGVILVTIEEAVIPVLEVTPLEVKQTIVGYGRAEKLQVQTMIVQQLGLPKNTRLQDDAADALAVALTAGILHAFSKRVQ